MLGHTFVQNMELLRHHITISELTYQASVVNQLMPKSYERNKQPKRPSYLKN